MLSKIAAVAHSKVALAVLGVVLVGGGGGAVAVAATTGHLSTLGVNVNAANGTPSSDSHGHTVGVEGLLTNCSATTTPATISVKDSTGKSWTFAVSATTKFNGDVNSAGAGASSAKGDNSTHAGDSSTTGAGASSAKGDNSTHAGDSSTHGDNSANAGDNSTTGAGASSAKGDNSANAGDNSAHAVTLAEVCASANIGTRNVQVQATKNGTSYDAWKVTLQGAGSANGDSSDGHSSTSGDSSSDGSDTGATSASSH